MRLALPRTNSGSGCWSASGWEEDGGREGLVGLVERGGGRGSELAMLSKRNLPSCSRKSLSLPVVLLVILLVEGAAPTAVHYGVPRQ